MKRFLIFVTLLAVIVGGANAEGTIKIGYFELKPYAIPQQGGQPPIGASIDYWNTIVAPAMNVKVQWVGPNPMLRLMSQLESGEVDAVLVLGKNPDREKKFLYPTTPYLMFRSTLAVNKDSPLKEIKTQDDIAGMRLGTAQGAVVPDFAKTAKVTWDNVTTPDWIHDCLVKLAGKRIDGVVDLGHAAMAYDAAQTLPGKFRFLPFPVPPAPIYTAFAKNERGAAFLKLYNIINDKNAPKAGLLEKKYTGQ
ncbi:MAG TPA: transporter substrate-binding domain-containing protein [Spirochaetia bacterium]|nr:transporter substrate-binding domain-containing protein [Spirochaetia bacterium]